MDVKHTNNIGESSRRQNKSDDSVKHISSHTIYFAVLALFVILFHDTLFCQILQLDIRKTSIQQNEEQNLR